MGCGLPGGINEIRRRKIVFADIWRQNLHQFSETHRACPEETDGTVAAEFFALAW
jgi:hypothetical protein